MHYCIDIHCDDNEGKCIFLYNDYSTLNYYHIIGMQIVLYQNTFRKVDRKPTDRVSISFCKSGSTEKKDRIINL